MARSTVQQVLASQDCLKVSELLITLLSEAAAGREIAVSVSEVAQGVLSSRWPCQVKSLAYALCKTSPLTDADARLVLAGIRGDMRNAADAELCVQALHFLPHLQPHLLAHLLSIGELVQICGPALLADCADVRAAATSALGTVLLMPEVVGAAAASTGMANQVAEQWQALTDALLDEAPQVVAAAATVAVALLQAGLGGETQNFLLQRLALLTAARVGCALGPVLSAANGLSLTGHAAMAHLLALVVKAAAMAGWAESQEAGAAGMTGLPPGTLLPGVGALAASVAAHLTSLARRADPAMRAEACRRLLQVSQAVRQQEQAGGAAEAAAVVPLPTHLVSDAVTKLLSLEEGAFLVEGGAEELVEAAIQGTLLLPPASRLPTLKRLLPAIARVKDSVARVALTTAMWSAAILPGQHSPSGSGPTPLLPSLLADRFLMHVLAGHLGVASADLTHHQHVQSLPPGRLSTTNSLAHAASERAKDAVVASTQDLLTGLAPEPSPRTSGNGSLAAKGGADGPHLPKSSSISKAVGSRLLASMGLGNVLGGKGGGVPQGSEDSKTSASGHIRPVLQLPVVTPVLNKLQGQDSMASQSSVAESYTSTPTTTPGPSMPAKPPGGPRTLVYGAQRHELVCSLAAVLMQHPCAGWAVHVCRAVGGAAAHNHAAGMDALGLEPQQMQEVLAWVQLVRQTVQATAGCLSWEPVVVPTITTHIAAAIAQRPPADFCTLAADSWLQLLQAAALTTRALLAAQKAGAHTLFPSKHTGPGLTEGTAAVESDEAMSSALVDVASSELKQLQACQKQVLREWGSLSRALRPRVMWVIARSLELSPHSDELWELATRALHDSLCKPSSAGTAVRVSELLSSAAAGVLYQSGRMGWPRDKPFVFDVVSGSALCERSDYEATSVVVGLAAAQAWAAALQDVLAATTLESVTSMQADIVFHAGRLEALLREFMATPEAAGSPPMREWCKRVVRALAATVVWEHPASRAEAERLAAAEEVEAAAAERVQEEANGEPSMVRGGSSNSSNGGGATYQLPVALPLASYLPAGRPRQSPQNMPGARGTSFMNGLTAQPSIQDVEGTSRDQQPFRTRAAVLYGQHSAHMILSCAGPSPWGYPFTPGPRATALASSKRSRRSRILQSLLGRAVAAGREAAAEPQSGGLQEGPLLAPHSAMRLDQPVFWSNQEDLQGIDGGAGVAAGTGPGVGAHELTGPADPLLLVGRVARTSERSTLLVTLTATSRSNVELRGCVVHVLSSGPGLVEKRGIAWSLPRLSPRDVATHSFQLRLTGCGAIVLQPRVQLIPASVEAGAGGGRSLLAPQVLACAGLVVDPVHHLLWPPPGALTCPVAPDQFFRAWGALPARTQLSAICTWPGRMGAALALSSMLSTPLADVLLNYLPATASYQAAFAGELYSGEEVMVVVQLQLLPPMPLPPLAVSQVAGAAPGDPPPQCSKKRVRPRPAATSAFAASPPRWCLLCSQRHRPGCKVWQGGLCSCAWGPLGSRWHTSPVRQDHSLPCTHVWLRCTPPHTLSLLLQLAY